MGTTSVLPRRLRDAFRLECMHVHEAGRGFNGCIHNWTKESSCPTYLRKQLRKDAEATRQDKWTQIDAETGDALGAERSGTGGGDAQLRVP